MGRENIKRGNNIFLYLTATILILTFSCTSFNNVQKRQYTGALFLKSDQLLTEKDFKGAIEENKKVLSLFVQGPPGDRALFNIAMIYAHYDNPARDYGKALDSFRKLIQEYPDSQFIEQSKNWERILARSAQLQLRLQEKTALLNKLVISHDAISRSNFKEALLANEKILSSDHSQSKDKALYNIGLIYADTRNPARSYQKTLQFFSKLLQDYPESPYSEEAKIWSDVIRIIEQSKQVDIEIEKKKKEMAR